MDYENYNEAEKKGMIQAMYLSLHEEIKGEIILLDKKEIGEKMICRFTAK
jgi:hypothetical protein